MEGREKVIQLIKQAKEDEELRKALISDPRGTLKEKAGLDIPDDVDISFKEEDFEKYAVDEILCQPFDDDALDEVAGGYLQGKGEDDGCTSFLFAIL
jgi:hypothetical protein